MDNETLNDITFDILVYGEIIRKAFAENRHDTMIETAKTLKIRIADLLDLVDAPDENDFDPGYLKWLDQMHEGLGR